MILGAWDHSWFSFTLTNWRFIVFNCHRLIVNNRLYCITHTWAQAKSIALMLHGLEEITYSIEGAFIEGIGF